MALTQIQQDGLSANAITAVLSAVFPYLTTSNVAEGSNLYYTNARVYSNVIALLPSLAGSGIQIQANGQINASAQSISLATLAPFLTTSNVSEGSNLYYTNARVLSALTGNVTIGNVAAGSVVFGTGIGGSVTGANLLSATNIQSNIWLGLYTSNVIESASNLYFTNARVYSNVIALLPTLAGQNITIAANGQISSTASGSSITSTSNVSEGSNLYYTNARVYSNVIALLAGNVTIGNVAAGSVVFGTGIGGSVTGANLISATTILANTWVGLYTANVIESAANLYFTNARVLSALTGNVTIGNLVIGTSVSNSYTTLGNVTAGNIIATGTVLFGSGDGGSIVGANLLSANNIQGINWLGLYSSNVIESSSALYYTNARVNSNVIAFLPSLAGQNITIAANGQINSTASGTSITSTSNVSEGSNLYYTNARVLSALTGNVIIGNAIIGSVVANTASFGTGIGGSVTGANLISANNLVANTALFGSGAGGSMTGANLLSATNIQANSWLGLYTSNVIETTGNLYFTNARVFANVIGFLPSLAGQNITIAANGQINSTASGSSITSTSNVSEGSNLYYTNARVLSALTGNVTIGNLVIGTSVSNSYTTVGNVTAGNVIATGTVLFGSGAGGSIVGANLLSANNIVANTASFGTGIGGSVTGANLISANNLVANTALFGFGTGGSMTGANLISATNIQANSWLGLYTSNVIESSGALYYTNARVYSNVIALLPRLAGSGIQIQANGQINANVVGVPTNSVVTGLIETTTITATPLAATATYDVITQTVLLVTANATNNWTLNVRGSSTTTLNSLLVANNTITLTVMATNGATPFYQSATQIDGNVQTVRWSNGVAPSAGNANSIDIYTLTIVKTSATPTYTIFGSQSRYT